MTISVGTRPAVRRAGFALFALTGVVAFRSSAPVRQRELEPRATMPVWSWGTSHISGSAPDAMGAAARPVPIGATAAEPAVPPGSTSALAPVRVTIPSLGVDADVDPVGIEPDGTIAAPTDFARAGWFTGGPEPGQAGPSVILGHVDNRTGPAVFFRLRTILPGAVIVVERADGSRVSFRAAGLETVPKGAFPSAAVYGPVPDAELRLITCGGPFDTATGHYRDNVIVFASAVPMST